MERMWSPWRSKHVKRATAAHTRADDAPSIFSQMADDDADEENLILWRGEEVFVVMNRYPYNNGHLLIVPYREVARYEALTEAEQTALARTTERCVRWLREALAAEGFNVGMNLGKAAGAGIPEHLHMHVVPRWTGDTNFMPTTAETKVLPEGLPETYRKLRAAVEASGEAASVTADGTSS